LRTFLRLLCWLAALVLVVVAAGVCWYIYRPLPTMDGTQTVPGLKQEVTVERDRWGVPHLRASNMEDLAEAQGYVMAQDRLWQMDLLRRVARGRLSEVFGPRTVKFDKQFRLLGVSQAADRDATLMDGEGRAILEAYARGVNRLIEQNRDRLPIEFSLLRYSPEPWKPADTFAISGYMYETLTNTWESKLNRARVTERVGGERAKDLFAQDSPMDHFVIGDPNVEADGSQHLNASDDEDDDDMVPDDVLRTGITPVGPDNAPDLSSALVKSIEGYLANTRSEIRHSLGSNNWVVSGDHTATGKPLLANDTHLELSMPPIWYEAHLTAPGYNVKGFTLPGAPLVVIGHNDRIAWGFTNNGADVQDLYIETLNPTQAEEYRVKGAWTKAQIRDEVIHVKGGADEHLRVMVTRHGPVMVSDSNKGFALRWTATEPGALYNTYNWVGRARNWEQFRSTLKRVWGPAQNAVYADTEGNIGYVMGARVPVRKKGHGGVPVPGDTDDYEWTGYIPFDQLPQALNPESGLIVTANARVVGPNYKPYLTEHWEEPYRTARIYELLHDRHDLRPQDMLRVQTDTYSFPHMFLAEQLLAANRSAQPKDERARRLIQQFKDWNGIADANSSVVTFLVAFRRAAMEILLEPYLGKDMSLYQWRSMNFLQTVLTDRPSKWLPPAFRSYDELLAAAADRAVASLEEQTKSTHIDDWSWRGLNSLDMLHPIGQQGLLKWLFSISSKPQSGTGFSVRAATKRHGPAMRFVANPANWDESILLIPAGQSGQLGSSHYSDQFSYWYEGKPIFAPFSEEAESAARKHTLTLKPQVP
jgi:penicillin G amidase